jgi:hypothetical protein
MWLKFLHIPKAFRCTNPKQERARYDTFQRMKKGREREGFQRERRKNQREREFELGGREWGESEW